jgi:hypothetical protein
MGKGEITSEFGAFFLKNPNGSGGFQECQLGFKDFGHCGQALDHLRPINFGAGIGKVNTTFEYQLSFFWGGCMK